MTSRDEDGEERAATEVKEDTGSSSKDPEGGDGATHCDRVGIVIVTASNSKDTFLSRGGGLGEGRAAVKENQDMSITSKGQEAGISTGQGNGYVR